MIYRIQFTPSVNRKEAEALMEHFRSRWVDPNYDQFVSNVMFLLKVDRRTKRLTSDIEGYDACLDLRHTAAGSPQSWVLSQLRAHHRVASVKPSGLD